MPRARRDYEYISIADFELVIKPMWGTKDTMYAIIMTLMRYRGLGPLAACKLHIEQVHNGKILRDRQRTGYKNVVELPPLAKKRLDWWIRNNKHRMVCGYLFSAQNSNRLFVSPNTVNRKWHKYLRKAPIEAGKIKDTNHSIPNAGRELSLLRLYDLRSSFLTDIQLKKGDIYLTSVIAGHKDTRATMTYMRKAVIVQEKKIMEELYND